MTRFDGQDRYEASVSIRSGRGSGTHDRVLRLHRAFHCRDEAARYAAAQGLAWVGACASPAAGRFIPQE